MIFYENCLPADNSHEISCLNFVIFEKAAKFEIIVGVALRVHNNYDIANIFSHFLFH